MILLTFHNTAIFLYRHEQRGGALEESGETRLLFFVFACVPSHQYTFHNTFQYSCDQLQLPNTQRRRFFVDELFRAKSVKYKYFFPDFETITYSFTTAGKEKRNEFSSKF
jgi:hypothetical protein